MGAQLSGATDANRQAPSMTLKQAFGFLRSHAILLAVCVTVGIAVGLAYCFLATPIFTARAQILINPRPLSSLRDPTNEAILTFDAPYIDTQIAVMKSGSLANTVMNEMNLWNDPEFNPPEAPNGPAASSEKDDAKTLAMFMRALMVRREGMSYVVNIDFSSRDPERAAKLSNAIAEAYIRDQVETRSRSIRQSNEWLVGRTEALRHRMKEATLAVQRFKARGDYRIADVADNPGHSSAETLTELESVAATYKKMYESYLQAQVEALQQQSFPVPNARILGEAVPPLESSLKRRWVLLLGAAAGFLAGLGLAVARDAYHGPSDEKDRVQPSSDAIAPVA